MTTFKSTLTIPATTSRGILVGALQIVSFTVLTALCAHARFYLPFTPVPITLQSFAVVLAGAFLGANKGLASQILLLVAGALGLNVFSAGTGFLTILGPTGGYLLGFTLSAFISGKIFEHQKRIGFLKTFNWLFVASLFIFLPGVVWLKTLTGSTWINAIQMGFVPFIIGDILKTLAAATVVKILK